MAVKFALGRVVATAGAISALVEAEHMAVEFVTRHSNNDWGEVSLEDRASNDRAVAEGAWLLSAYALSTGVTIWIITESDRSSTTLLLPEEW